MKKLVKVGKELGMAWILSFIGICLFAVIASAEVEKEREGDKISDVIEVSFAENQGNVETKSFAAKNTLDYVIDNKLSAKWVSHGLFSEAGGERNAETYKTELVFYNKIDNGWYVIERQGWEKDPYRGTNEEYSGGIGIGKKKETGKHTIDASIGADYKRESFTDDTNRSYTSTRGLLRYKYTISDSVTLGEEAVYVSEIGDTQNYEISADTFLTTKISDSMGLKIGYRVDYDNKPMPGFSKLDTGLNVSLVITYL